MIWPTKKPLNFSLLPTFKFNSRVSQRVKFVLIFMQDLLSRAKTKSRAEENSVKFGGDFFVLKILGSGFKVGDKSLGNLKFEIFVRDETIFVHAQQGVKDAPLKKVDPRSQKFKSGT